MAQLHARQQPPAITQLSLLSCWAAALSSWLLAVKSQKAPSQKDLIKTFGADDDYIDIGKFQKVADDFGMATRRLDNSSSFTAERLLERLENASVLLIGFVVGDNFWHDVVLYGVILGDKVASYAIMDPGPSGPVATMAGSDKAQYVRVAQSYFFPAGKEQQWLIGWSKTKTPGAVSVSEIQVAKP